MSHSTTVERVEEQDKRAEPCWQKEISLEHCRVGYALVSEALHILKHDAYFAVCLNQEGVGLTQRPLLELFPELVGMERDLHDLIHHEKGSVVLTAVEYRPQAYRRLKVASYKTGEAVLLVSVEDVTEQAMQEQMLRQQRNELHLLSENLILANEQLAYLLQRFVPEQVAKKLMATRHLPYPGGEQKRVVTILFADMRQFTALAERLSPEETLDVLNAYLEVVAQGISLYGGSLVQIVGDLMMGAFNAPDDQPDHPWRAIQTAVNIRERLATLSAERAQAGLPVIGFGLGISTGEAITGYLGAQSRYQYATVGDVTNVAFHLCSQAAAGQILVNAQTVQQIEASLTVRDLGEVTLKRRRTPVQVVELIGID